MVRSDGVTTAAAGDQTTDSPILKISDLVVEFPVRSKIMRREVGRVHAVDGVNLTIHAGETVALVGESGCGKSTLARTIIGLNEPERGQVLLGGVDLTTCTAAEMKRQRRNVQLVFQNSFGSLNPRMKVKDIVSEPLIAYQIGDKAERSERTEEALALVGLDASQGTRYAHEFSGGQRQRIGIARALVLRPHLVILDEPVSALDVSIQAQIINLLRSLQQQLGLSYLLISHDLAVVRHIAHRVEVMYLGRIIESGACKDVFGIPTHPYTEALRESVPVPDPTRADIENRRVLEGDLPSPMRPPSGCRFRTRCWQAEELCATEEPLLIPRTTRRRLCACHFPLGDEARSDGEQ